MTHNDVVMMSDSILGTPAGYYGYIIRIYTYGGKQKRCYLIYICNVFIAIAIFTSYNSLIIH